MKNKNEWFKFEHRVWLEDERVLRMSLAAQGLYVRALCYQVRHGSLPSERSELAVVLMAPSATAEEWDSVLSHFEAEQANTEIRLFNKKLRGILVVRQEVSRVKSENRRNKCKTDDKDTLIKRKTKRAPRASYSLSLSYSSSLEDFNTFWEHYPRYRRDKKKATFALWQKVVTTPELGAKIIAHVKDRVLKDPQWRDNNGQFAVGPQVFLNGENWEDDYSARAAQIVPVSKFQKQQEDNTAFYAESREWK